jgi:hypothetical protein
VGLFTPLNIAIGFALKLARAWSLLMVRHRLAVCGPVRKRVHICGNGWGAGLEWWCDFAGAEAVGARDGGRCLFRWGGVGAVMGGLKSWDWSVVAWVLFGDRASTALGGSRFWVWSGECF